MSYGVYTELEKLKKQLQEKNGTSTSTTTITPVIKNTGYGVYEELQKLQEQQNTKSTYKPSTKKEEKKEEKEEETLLDDDIAPVKEEEESWFRKGALADGLSLKNIGKAILGTNQDASENFLAGIVGMGEKAVDALATIAPYLAQGMFYQNGGGFAPIEVQQIQNQAIDVMKQGSSDFVQKDLYDEKKVAKALTKYTVANAVGGADNSVLGTKADALIQSGGQLAGTAALSAAGVPWYLTTGVTSFGSESESALKQGASLEEATISAAVTAGAEILTEKISAGINFGGKTFIPDELLAQQIGRTISDKTARTLVKLGVDAAGEGFEEVLSNAISAVGQKLTYDKDKDISAKELFFSEEAFDNFIGGVVLSGGIGSVNAIKTNVQGGDYATGLTNHEKAVVDKEYKNRVAEAEKNGKLSQAEKSKIYKQVLESMDKGYISIDTIEEAIGGDTYKAYQDALKSEDALKTELETLNKMKQGDMTGEQIDRRAELKELLKQSESEAKSSQLKSKLSEEVAKLAKDSRLVESYNEVGRRTQKFEADLSRYDAKQQEVIKKAVESGILNNSNRTHEFVDLVAKISADKGVLFDFTNNAKLKESGFAIDGKQINGYVTKDGVTINIQSAKSLNSVVGHEISHVLEGTELYTELQNAVVEYAKTKGDYQGRYDTLSKLYEGVEGANIDAELTADLVGDYLFTDADFINNLSTNHRNVFEKIYDEVKYLLKVATAGSKEARELERVKHYFDKAYQQAAQAQKNTTVDGGVKYSVSDKNIKDESTGYYSGENYFTMSYTQDGKVVAKLDYGVYDGEPNVKMIEVDPEYRRKGIATKLMQELQNKYTDTEINFGMATPDGSKLLESITYDATDEAVAADRQKLKDLQTELNDLQEKLDVLFDTENLTEEQHSEMEKLGDRWQEVYETIFALEKSLLGKKATKTFVKTDAKYSLSDSNGRQLSNEQQSFFKNSVVRDENGNLKVMYHGTSNGGHTVFDTWGKSKYGLFGTGSYFTDSKAIAESYTKKGKGKNPQVYESYLNITNPLDMDAPANPAEWTKAFDEVDFPESGTNEDFYRAVEEYYSDQYMPKWEVAEIIRESIEFGMGYDGLTHIGGSRVNADGERHRVYIAFESEQIKNTDNVNPTSDPDVRYSLSKSEIHTIQNVGRKSINKFDSNDIAATEKFAQRYWDEMGTKSPFYRAWFGDWRANDTAPVTFATKQGDTRVDHVNKDTGWNIRNSGQVHSETKALNSLIHREAVPYLPYIDEIIENAVLLDTEGVGKRKSENSLLMHYMYAVADIGNGPEVLKLTVEEMYNPGEENTNHRAYVLQNIEKAFVVRGRVQGNTPSSGTNTTNAVKTVADLFALVKSMDSNFVPNESSKIVNADGTPKVMYHGSPERFTQFDRSKAKSSGLYGKGFYFTDSESHAGTYGNLYKVYLDIKNPLQSGSVTVTRDQVRSYLEAVAENEDYSIENYGTYDIDAILDIVVGEGSSVDAFKVIQDINTTAIGDMVEAAELFNDVNGTKFDGIVVPTETVAFYPEQIKSATDNIGTFDKNSPNIQLSLAEEGAQHPAYGDYNVYGKDVALETDDIAPIAENAAPVAENDTIAAENSVEDLFPDDLAPVQEEYENLLAERDDIQGAMDAYAAIGDTASAEQLMGEYEAVQARIAEIESEDAERFASLDEADAPVEMDNAPEDVADNVPLTKVLVNNLARTIKAKLGLANNQMAEVRSLIERYSAEEFPSKAHLYTEIAERFGRYTESYVDEELKGVKALLRTYGIKVDDSIKRDIADYGQLRKSNFGKVRFSNDGLPVDVAYQEFQEALPGLFPASVDVPSDQLLRIIEVANMDTTFTQEYDIDSEMLEEITDTIMQGVAEFKQNRKETLANRHGRESFNSLMESADQYVPPVQIRNDPPRATQRVQASPDDIAPVFDTSSGQQAIMPEVETPKPLTRSVLHENIMDNIKTTFAESGFDFDNVLKKAKDLSTFATVDNTPQRVMEKALGYKAGQTLSDLTVNKVAQNETDGIRWLNSFTDRKNGLLAKISKQYHIKPGSKASAAAQMYAEGFYVGENDAIIAYGDRELAADFPNAKVQENIKRLARDPRIRQIYDETLAAINESRKRNAYPEIPRLDNYFLHFRAMDDTFSRLGLPFNPNDIRAKDLPTDLNGVTADLKPGQPYFASAMHRKGKRTSFDLLGGLENYLTSAKNQIYHIDDIQTLRALRNYIAETYGQASGLENLDLLSDEEAEQRIEQVYNSHLSTFAKFLNEEANVLAGKTALIDRGLEGVIGRRGITFLNTLNRQVGANMVGFNVSSSLTNFLAPVQAFAKTNKFDFTKAMAQTAYSKLGSIFGVSNTFAEESPVMIRRKGAERFYRTPYQKVGDAGYVLMGVVDDISTELIARTKYNEFTRKGMDSQQAHIETDKWVSRLMGDRSLGQQPQLYNSKMLGLFTKFQLEVRNQLDSQFYDTIQEAKVSSEQIENKLLRNAKTAAKVTATFAQLAVMQHLFGKAFESVAGYNPAFDIIEALIKTFGWDDEEESEDTVLDNIEQGFLELLGDLPYTSTLTGGRIPIASALPITEFINGEDQYGNEKNRWQTLAEAAPYYLLPGGYGQIKKTKAGLDMFSDDHPIAGSYTDSGNLRFPVEDTFGNRVQAGLFGQWASENARDYFDNERKPLNEKQTSELINTDMPIAEYWAYLDGLRELDTLQEKVDYIAGLDLPTHTKNMLVNNIADRKEAINLVNYDQYSSLEEMDFAIKNPEKYAVAQAIGGYAAYRGYQVGMKDLSLAEKVDYVAGLNLTTEQKNILINSETDRKEPIDLTGYENYSSFEEFEYAKKNPESYAMAKSVGGYDAYMVYSEALGDIKADKNEWGESISGSRKPKVYNYIYSLNISDIEKHILFKSQHPSTDTYNYQILEYLDSREDISWDEMKAILIKLDFKVSDDGRIRW